MSGGERGWILELGTWNLELGLGILDWGFWIGDGGGGYKNL